MLSYVGMSEKLLVCVYIYILIIHINMDQRKAVHCNVDVFTLYVYLYLIQKSFDHLIILIVSVFIGITEFVYLCGHR